MEFLEGLRDLIKPPTEIERKFRAVKKEVTSILRAKEKEFKASGDRSASFYSFDNEFSLRWDLRMGSISDANRTGWESKSLRIEVNPDATTNIKYGYKEPQQDETPTYSQHLPIETRPEYHLAERSAELLAKEMGEESGQSNNQELSLNKRIDIAIKLAGHTSDGRYDRILD